MRFATYNLWNSDQHIRRRVALIADTIRALRADVVGLQEVRAPFDADANLFRSLAAHTGYQHVSFVPHPAEPGEGIAIMSRFPLTDVEGAREGGFAGADRAMRAVVHVGGATIGFTTVHLDASSVPILDRERQMVGIAQWIAARARSTDHEVLCGDFNCHPGSSIHSFLLGQQSLHGRSTQWFDLALLQAHRSGQPPPPTLDFNRNPRWADSPTIEIPARFDWLLLRDCHPRPYPEVRDVGLFGMGSTEGIAGSDHYGVYADIMLP